MHSTKKESPTLADSPNILKCYWIASRPKTWMAGISPVLIGTALSVHQGMFAPGIFGLTLLFSLLIQIGTNFANDAFDFINGADTEERKGPKRATQQGWISPQAMLRAALVTFGAALIFALPLMMIAGLWSLSVAILSVLFGILYTGGPKPLGYLGLGELLVFIFFGPVAVCGTYFLQTGTLHLSTFIASLAPAFLSTAILVANNLRDEISDRAAHKRTLIVRWGRKFGGYEYGAMIVAAALVPSILVALNLAPGPVMIASLSLAFGAPLIRKAFLFKDPLELISLLHQTSLLLFFYTLLFCIILIW